MLIGVTGLIGSGKSAVAAVFGSLGATIIDCDRIGREVVETDDTIRYRLVLAFGQTILTGSRTLDRRRLGRLAFGSIEQTELLNSIVHPPLLARLDEQMVKAKQSGHHAVVDAALLINWGYHKKMDYTILVSATAKNRTKRLLSCGLTFEEILLRTKSQLSLSYLRRFADYVIVNDTDLANLRVRAEKIYRQLTGEK
jgi:dephospho-CoA kinase